MTPLQVATDGWLSGAGTQPLSLAFEGWLGDTEIPLPPVIWTGGGGGREEYEEFMRDRSRLRDEEEVLAVLMLAVTGRFLR